MSSQASNALLPLGSVQVGVVVLNYNGWQDTLACLEHVCRLVNAPRRIVVCDNGSQDGSIDKLLEAWAVLAPEAGFPALVEHDPREALPPAGASLLLLRLQDNDGFSAGNNAGLRLLLHDAGCAAFWLLNNDTTPLPMALEALLHRANDDPRVGMTGSSMVWYENHSVLQCAAGGSFTPLLGTTRLLAEGRLLEDARKDCAALETQLAFVLGASMLVRREVIENVGLLDDVFFLYYEDVEWCLRAVQQGFRIAWAPESVVPHREGGASGASSAGRKAQQPVRSRLIDYLCIRNRFYLLRGYNPAALPLAFLSLVVVFVKRLQRGQADRCSLLLRAAFDGLLGRMGKPISIFADMGN